MEILIWIFLAGLTSYIAGEKGRNIAGWFVLGLALPILSTILLIVLPSQSYSETTKRMEPAEPKHRKCQYCSEKILREAVKCKHCKSDLQPAG